LDWTQGSKSIYHKANENLQVLEEVQGGDFFPHHSASIGTGEQNKLKLVFPSTFFEIIKKLGSLKKSSVKIETLSNSKENVIKLNHINHLNITSAF